VKNIPKKTVAQACTFPTAIGEMAIAWRADKVIGIFLPEASLAKLLARVRGKLRFPRLAWTSTPPAHAGHIAAQIRTHLRGEPQEFTAEHLGFPVSGPFTRKVYECSLRIPSGTVVTYQELAKKAGSPKAFRAVGQAMARNPFPIVVPCHRVVGTGKPGAKKSAGGFSAYGGLTTKARILELEGNSPLE
jgi:methylated-DNA-[protein]-cysteine S-methyltransferase